MASIRIGEIIKYPNKPSLLPEIDELPNWYFLTAPPTGESWAAIKLDSGINTSSTKGVAASRPFLALRSSPHKFGTSTTPWEDIHRPDQGFSRYYGDAKPGSKTAADYLGNRRMLEAFLLHQGDKEDRVDAPPVFIFEAVPYLGKPSGQVIFHGVGVITKAELVVQRQEPNKTNSGKFPKGVNFSNYVFDIALLDLSHEGEQVDWKWINARRNPDIDPLAALKFAPKSWQQWVKEGSPSLGRLRRNVLTRTVVTDAMQKPAVGSPEQAILVKVYEHYSGKKHRFEGLAEFVIGEIFREQGLTYAPGWITQASNDGGYDFVGRLDLDPVGPIRTSRQVVLGQAKCEKTTTPTNGLHIARLAARLRRGWIGAYVTTSFFSISVQREVLADRYPIVLVDGLRLSSVIRQYLTNNGVSIENLLTEIDSTYDSRVGFGDPDAVLA